MKPVALVTGGARGIGLGISQCLAKEGFDLAIAGTRAEKEAAKALEQLRSLGSEVLYVRADISDRVARKKLLAAIGKQFGRLNVLVNNAGVAPNVRADLLEATEESYERVMKINLQGPYFLTQAVANWIVKQKKANASFSGCIVNISSISASVVSTNRGEYCLSKAGIRMATRLWAARLGEFDIPVYEVAPGVIHSDMTAGVTAKYDKLIAEGLTAQKRWGESEDVGRAVAALARGDFPYSTGAVITVDGGLTMQRL